MKTLVRPFQPFSRREKGAAGLFGHPQEGPLFMETYLRLREKVWRLSAGAAAPSLCREAPSLNEKTLRLLWYEGRYERRRLSTDDGRPLTVINPGEWNLDEGPDFLGAVVRQGDETRRGDVEVHLLDRDWQKHRHHRNARFNNVILHVYLYASKKRPLVRTAGGRVIPSVHLWGRLPEPWSALVDRFDATGYPYNSQCGLGACGRNMDVRQYETLEHLLAWAADGRILLKGAARATGMSSSADSQRFLGKVFEVLGYHKNKEPMRRLGEKLSWERLKKEMGAVPPGDRIDTLEAVLLGAARLIPTVDETWDAETRRVAERCDGLWRRWRARLLERAEDNNSLPWVWRGIRPANYPTRRLAGLAVLLSRWLAPSTDKGSGRKPFLESVWDRSRRAAPEKLLESFYVPARGYFGRRSVWGGRVLRRPVSLIGPDRAQALWVNAALPTAVRAARRQGDRAMEGRLHRFFRHLPLREPNGTARLMAHRLLGAERIRQFCLKEEWKQQGLLQVFQDFCDTKSWACQNCPLPHWLRKVPLELEMESG